MTKAILISLASLLILSFQSPAAAQGTMRSSRLFVHAHPGDDSHCPDSNFYSIQDAVDAADPGDTVHVCPGEYPEQVVVTKQLKLEADEGAVLAPNLLFKNAVDVSTGEPLAAALLVRDAREVHVFGFTVDLSKSGVRECTPKLVAILYQNASGVIGNNHVSHVGLPDSLLACQSGDAIEVQSGQGGQSEVSIRRNTIEDFHKDGIIGSGKGTDLYVEANQLISSNATEAKEREGIRIESGATATIDENEIIGTGLPSSPPIQGCGSFVIGIAVFDSDAVAITGNAIDTPGTSIFVAGSNNRVLGNYNATCAASGGIEIIGNENEVAENRFGSGGPGAILVQGKNNWVELSSVIAGTLKQND